jgi:hypothetical protein
MWYQNKLGLRGPLDDVGNFLFFEIPSAPDTVNPLLGEMLEPFKNSSVPRDLEMAQIRFRCKDADLKGIWIDCSNLLIKALLDEKNWLSHLISNLGWKEEDTTVNGFFGDKTGKQQQIDAIKNANKIYAPSGQEIPKEEAIKLTEQGGKFFSRNLLRKTTSASRKMTLVFASQKRKQYSQLQTQTWFSEQLSTKFFMPYSHSLTRMRLLLEKRR